jgi:hypothetical protein
LAQIDRALVSADDLGKKREGLGVREIPSRETIAAMRHIAMAVLVAASGCSLGMKRVTPDYDPRTIPRCETNPGAPTMDVLGALLLAGGGVAVAVAGHSEDNSRFVAAGGMVLVGGIFALVAKAGFGWHRECVQVKRDWDDMQIEQDSLVRREAAKRQFEAIKEREARSAPPAPTPRDVMLAAAPDVSECTLTEQAWCVADTCFPSLDVCTVRGARADVAECEESE